MGKKIIGLLIGLLCGGLVVALIESISSLLHPMPEHLDPKNIEDMKAFVASLPVSAFLIVLIAHTLGSLTAGFISSLYLNRPWTAGAVILGGFFLMAGIGNLVIIPHPVWFTAIDVLIYLPATYFGAKLTSGIIPTEN